MEKFSFNYIYAFCKSRFLFMICRFFSHNFSDEGYSDPESGQIILCCKRCGWSSTITLY